MEKNNIPQEWLKIAIRDYEMAKVALSHQMNLYVAFHCQQSLEKSFKGLYILLKNDQPPYIHDLGRLHSLLKDDIKDLNLKIEVLEKLSAYYITTRYPSYKKIIEEQITSEDLKAFLDSTHTLILCLEQKLK